MTVSDYIDSVPEDRAPYFSRLRQTILDHLPDGYEECINYKMLGYVVPQSRYPDGYHCDPKLPLPFMNLANQKNFIGFYHMGIYANPDLHGWFTTSYPDHAKYKLDMGKSCIRFKRMDDIPFGLIGELVSKMSVDDWISLYEAQIKT